MAGQKGMKHYPIELRQKIVKEHVEDGYSLATLCNQYSLHETQIKCWCKWTKQYGLPKQMTGKKKGRPKQSGETLEEKVKRLEMENTLLKKFHELLREEHKRK